MVGRTYDVVTYDIQEYRRYNVAYDIVGVSYDVVVNDLRYRLSVLQSHFNSTCITVLKQLLSKSEKRFDGTHWVQEWLGLSEVLCVKPVLFVGKCGFPFRRFKNGSCALATRAKTHCLD